MSLLDVVALVGCVGVVVFVWALAGMMVMNLQDELKSRKSKK